MHKFDIVGTLNTYAQRVSSATSSRRIIEILQELRKEFDLRTLKKIEGVRNDR